MSRTHVFIAQWWYVSLGVLFALILLLHQFPCPNNMVMAEDWSCVPPSFYQED